MTEQKKRNSLPKSVLIVWILVTLFAPFAVFFYIITGVGSVMDGTIYSLLWAVISRNDYSFRGMSFLGLYIPVDSSNVFYGLHILNPMILLMVPVYGFFNILFAVQVVRYAQAKTSMSKTALVGLLTLAIPLYEIFIFVPYMLSNGYLHFTGPIPIQLIVGLLIAKKYSPKPPETPWE